MSRHTPHAAPSPPLQGRTHKGVTEQVHVVDEDECTANLIPSLDHFRGCLQLGDMCHPACVPEAVNSEDRRQQATQGDFNHPSSLPLWLHTLRSDHKDMEPTDTLTFVTETVDEEKLVSTAPMSAAPVVAEPVSTVPVSTVPVSAVPESTVPMSMSTVLDTSVDTMSPAMRPSSSLRPASIVQVWSWGPAHEMNKAHDADMDSCTTDGGVTETATAATTETVSESVPETAMPPPSASDALSHYHASHRRLVESLLTKKNTFALPAQWCMCVASVASDAGLGYELVEDPFVSPMNALARITGSTFSQLLRLFARSPELSACMAALAHALVTAETQGGQHGAVYVMPFIVPCTQLVRALARVARLPVAPATLPSDTSHVSTWHPDLYTDEMVMGEELPVYTHATRHDGSTQDGMSYIVFTRPDRTTLSDAFLGVNFRSLDAVRLVMQGFKSAVNSIVGALQLNMRPSYNDFPCTLLKCIMEVRDFDSNVLRVDHLHEHNFKDLMNVYQLRHLYNTHVSPNVATMSTSTTTINSSSSSSSSGSGSSSTPSTSSALSHHRQQQLLQQQQQQQQGGEGTESMETGSGDENVCSSPSLPVPSTSEACALPSLPPVSPTPSVHTCVQVDGDVQPPSPSHSASHAVDDAVDDATAGKPMPTTATTTARSAVRKWNPHLFDSAWASWGRTRHGLESFVRPLPFLHFQSAPHVRTVKTCIRYALSDYATCIQKNETMGETDVILEARCVDWCMSIMRRVNGTRSNNGAGASSCELPSVTPVQAAHHARSILADISNMRQQAVQSLAGHAFLVYRQALSSEDAKMYYKLPKCKPAASLKGKSSSGGSSNSGSGRSSSVAHPTTQRSRARNTNKSATCWGSRDSGVHVHCHSLPHVEPQPLMTEADAPVYGFHDAPQRSSAQASPISGFIHDTMVAFAAATATASGASDATCMTSERFSDMVNWVPPPHGHHFDMRPHSDVDPSQFASPMTQPPRRHHAFRPSGVTVHAPPPRLARNAVPRSEAMDVYAGVTSMSSRLPHLGAAAAVTAVAAGGSASTGVGASGSASTEMVDAPSPLSPPLQSPCGLHRPHQTLVYVGGDRQPRANARRHDSEPAATPLAMMQAGTWSANSQHPLGGSWSHSANTYASTFVSSDASSCADMDANMYADVPQRACMDASVDTFVGMSADAYTDAHASIFAQSGHMSLLRQQMNTSERAYYTEQYEAALQSFNSQTTDMRGDDELLFMPDTCVMAGNMSPQEHAPSSSYFPRSCTTTYYSSSSAGGGARTRECEDVFVPRWSSVMGHGGRRPPPSHAATAAAAAAAGGGGAAAATATAAAAVAAYGPAYSFHDSSFLVEHDTHVPLDAPTRIPVTGQRRPRKSKTDTQAAPPKRRRVSARPSSPPPPPRALEVKRIEERGGETPTSGHQHVETQHVNPSTQSLSCTPEGRHPTGVPHVPTPHPLPFTTQAMDDSSHPSSVPHSPPPSSSVHVVSPRVSCSLAVPPHSDALPSVPSPAPMLVSSNPACNTVPNMDNASCALMEQDLCPPHADDTQVHDSEPSREQPWSHSTPLPLAGGEDGAPSAGYAHDVPFPPTQEEVPSTHHEMCYHNGVNYKVTSAADAKLLAELYDLPKSVMDSFPPSASCGPTTVGCASHLSSCEQLHVQEQQQHASSVEGEEHAQLEPEPPMPRDVSVSTPLCHPSSSSPSLTSYVHPVSEQEQFTTLQTTRGRGTGRSAGRGGGRGTGRGTGRGGGRGAGRGGGRGAGRDTGRDGPHQLNVDINHEAQSGMSPVCAPPGGDVDYDMVSPHIAAAAAAAAGAVTTTASSGVVRASVAEVHVGARQHVTEGGHAVVTMSTRGGRGRGRGRGGRGGGGGNGQPRGTTRPSASTVQDVGAIAETREHSRDSTTSTRGARARGAQSGSHSRTPWITRSSSGGSRNLASPTAEDTRMLFSSGLPAPIDERTTYFQVRGSIPVVFPIQCPSTTDHTLLSSDASNDTPFSALPLHGGDADAPNMTHDEDMIGGFVICEHTNTIAPCADTKCTSPACASIQTMSIADALNAANFSDALHPHVDIPRADDSGAGGISGMEDAQIEQLTSACPAHGLTSGAMLAPPRQRGQEGSAETTRGSMFGTHPSVSDTQPTQVCSGAGRESHALPSATSFRVIPSISTFRHALSRRILAPRVGPPLAQQGESEPRTRTPSNSRLISSYGSLL